MGKRYPEQEKRRHADALRASGLSKVAYAEKSGVSPGTLTKWLEAYPPKSNGNGNGAHTNGANGNGHSATHGQEYVTVSLPRGLAKSLIQSLADQL